MTYKRNYVREGLLFLEKEGWSDIVDKRWESMIRESLINEFPYIDDQSLNEIIDVITW